jgi:hypothetical protein
MIVSACFLGEKAQGSQERNRCEDAVECGQDAAHAARIESREAEVSRDDLALDNAGNQVSGDDEEYVNADESAGDLT